MFELNRFNDGERLNLRDDPDFFDIEEEISLQEILEWINQQVSIRIEKLEDELSTRYSNENV